MKRLALNILLMLISTLICLVLLEVFLRIRNYDNKGGWKFMLFDKEVGMGPGLELIGADFIWMDEADFDTSRNNHVIIYKQKVPFEKTPGEVRIVSIGDSGTQGSGVNLEESYPILLSGILKEKGADHVRVVNAGMHITNTIGQYKVLKYKLLKIHPDIVTVGVYMANDFNMLLSPENFLGPNSGIFWSAINKLNNVSVLSRLLYSKLMLINSMHRIFTGTSLDERSPFRVPEQSPEVRGLNPLSFEEGEVMTYLKEDSKLMNEAYTLFEEVLNEIKKLGIEHGFQVVVVEIPQPSLLNGRIMNPYLPELEELLRLKGIYPEHLDFEKSTLKLKSICEKLDLVFINPTSELRNLKEPFLSGNDHLNGSGYRVVAEKMVECFDFDRSCFMQCP